MTSSETVFIPQRRDSVQATFKAKHEFPLRVTRYFASLIEKGNVLDPLLLQVLPDAREFMQVDGYNADAVGDQQAMPVPGLIHKYHGRVLLTLTGACAIHCRYCFRRHFPYSEAGVDYNLDGQVMTYLADNPEISEVILSGGDPLMVADHKLARLIDKLNSMSHIRVLRIHSCRSASPIRYWKCCDSSGVKSSLSHTLITLRKYLPTTRWLSHC